MKSQIAQSWMRCAGAICICLLLVKIHHSNCGQTQACASDSERLQRLPYDESCCSALSVCCHDDGCMSLMMSLACVLRTAYCSSKHCAIAVPQGCTWPVLQRAGANASHIKASHHKLPFEGLAEHDTQNLAAELDPWLSVLQGARAVARRIKADHHTCCPSLPASPTPQTTPTTCPCIPTIPPCRGRIS